MPLSSILLACLALMLPVLRDSSTQPQLLSFKLFLHPEFSGELSLYVRLQTGRAPFGAKGDALVLRQA